MNPVPSSRVPAEGERGSMTDFIGREVIHKFLGRGIITAWSEDLRGDKGRNFTVQFMTREKPFEANCPNTFNDGWLKTSDEELLQQIEADTAEIENIKAVQRDAARIEEEAEQERKRALEAEKQAAKSASRSRPAGTGTGSAPAAPAVPSVLPDIKAMYGIHIEMENSCMDESNPHVCIGWSAVGDLTDLKNKDELKAQYIAANITAKDGKIQTDISEIARFRFDVSAGDLVVFFSNPTAHFGIITSDYKYVTDTPGQNPDYVNNRDIAWIKDVPYADLPQPFAKTRNAQLSFWSVEKYREQIAGLISEEYEAWKANNG